MKQLATALACLTLLACASSTGTAAGADAAKVPPPDFEFVQLVGPEEQNWPQGEIEVQYAVRITNKATEPIRLRQIELSPVGMEGAYTVARQSYFFDHEVGATGAKEFAFWAKAYSEGKRYGINAQSPISVRAVAYFQSASGPFRKVFTAHMSQAASKR